MGRNRGRNTMERNQRKKKIKEITPQKRKERKKDNKKLQEEDKRNHE